ncbi:FUSC family protein [Gordonia sp. CPCC 206044]|uniref:FUSC family protein n=1 Tax=Gordonia sp. CPCC 206044 TaxID=3140793 RepID=UPI003AF3D19C
MATPTSVDQVRHRRGALAHAMKPSVWRSTLAVDMSRTGFAVPFRVGIAVGLVLVVGGLTGQRDVAGFAALGALISAFCRPDPYRVRTGRLAVLGVATVASVGVGASIGLADAPLTVEIAVIALLGGAAALLVGALHITGPGAVVFVFAANGAVSFAHTTGDLTRAMVAAAIGALVGAAASLAPWIAEGVRSRLRPAASPDPAVSAPTVRYESIRTTLTRRPGNDLLANSFRIVAGIAASAAIATAIGLSHPMWAAMGAMAAMQGVRYHVTVQRGLQRLIGNIAGGVIAAILLGIGLGYWQAVIAIVACQIVAEIMAPANYAIASTAVTPMALLLTALSAGLTPDAALDRVADTLIGIVVGIVIAAVTITRQDRFTA